MQIRNMLSAIDGDLTRFSKSPNGVKFSTICRDCNRDLLGAKYDRHLNRFARWITNRLRGRVWHPRILHCRTRPVALLKSLLGHILAAKPEYHESPIDDAMRRFVLRDEPLARDLTVFYWVYPFPETRVSTDFGMHAVRGAFDGPWGVFSVLKFFPVAFLAAWECTEYHGLPSFAQYRGLAPEDEAEVPVRFDLVPRDPGWPEGVGDSNVVLYTSGAETSVIATPAKRRRG